MDDSEHSTAHMVDLIGWLGMQAGHSCGIINESKHTDIRMHVISPSQIFKLTAR